MVEKTAKVFIVGAGPGNPQLLTLRAVECLQQADVILHDRLIPKDILAHFAPQAKLVYVGKKASFHTLPQDEIEDLLVNEAKKGKVVVRLKGGDPFIFGRGGEECERLADEGIDFEVVPGISSAFSVPLYAGIPLTHRNFSTEIAIVTGHENSHKNGEIPYKTGVERKASSWVDWEAIAKMGTIVFLMGVGNARANMKKLKEFGKPGDTPVAVTRWGGLGKQKTLIGTIDDIADKIRTENLKAPAIIVVGGVVGLSKKINWFERGAFHGKIFLITRDPESNQKLSKMILEKSGHVIHWPSFDYVETRASQDLQKGLKKIAQFDWLIFTSTRAVTFFLKKYDKMHSDLRPLAGVKIAAVGKETANKLREERLWVDLVPRKNSVQGLIEESAFRRKKNLKIFIPQAQDAKKDFVEAYQARHKVFAASIYKKKFMQQDPTDVEKIVRKKVDWVLFFSPSAVDGFLKNFDGSDGMDFLRRTNVGVIGRTTGKYLKGFGLEPKIVSRMSSSKELIGTIKKFALKGQL